MTKQLTPRTLDIVITKISAKTIHYELKANGNSEHWRIPADSKFDKSVLVIGERYRVTTRVIRSKQWSYKTQKQTYQDSFDWVFAEKRSAVAHCTVRAKSQINETITSMPLVDGGELFKWR